MRRSWLLLVFAASLALWVWRQPRGEGPDAAAAGGNRATEPGFVATGAELFDTDLNGQPQYRLHASRIEQPSPKADIELSAPEFHYQGETTWLLTAQEGVLPPDAQQITLSGDVQVTAQRPHEPPLHIRTVSLGVDLQQQRIDTAAFVAMDFGANRLWATGLHADMKADSLRLESRVRGEFVRR